jgi:hypothetical protein
MLSVGRTPVASLAWHFCRFVTFSTASCVLCREPSCPHGPLTLFRPSFLSFSAFLESLPPLPRSLTKIRWTACPAPAARSVPASSSSASPCSRPRSVAATKSCPSTPKRRCATGRARATGSTWKTRPARRTTPRPASVPATWWQAAVAAAPLSAE